MACSFIFFILSLGHKNLSKSDLRVIINKAATPLDILLNVTQCNN